jgi:glycosyltransferase involved in cell wall biosynthesis
VGEIRLMAVLPGMWARGAEICTLNLLAGLKAIGYKHLFFHAALGQALPAEMELHLQPRFQEVAEVSYGIHGDRDGTNLELIQAVKNAQPDLLLYAFDKSIPSYCPAAKSILVVHGMAENDFAGYSPAYTDAVVCVSQYAADMAPLFGIPKDKIHTIANGVPKAAGVSRREEWGIPDDAWVWCFVGGLTRLKRPQLLIAALSRRDREDEYAIFAGHPDTGMMLEEYAEALGVRERCIFLGQTDAVGDVYHSSDCLVVTSQRESMPLIILEAMSIGLPVVANKVGGIPEILRKPYGNLCDVEKEKEFDDTLNLCVSLKRSIGYEAARICAQLVWNDYFALDVMASRYDNLFYQLLEA